MKLRYLLLTWIIALFSFASVFAQDGGVLIDPSETQTREPSAVLQVSPLQSTTPNDYGGFLVPRMNLTDRGNIGSPATGLLIYQTDNTPGYYYFDGAVWTRLFEGTGNNNVTGAGAATRVTFWDGANSLSSDGNLFWDNGNDRLGIGTANPSTKLDVVGVLELSGTNPTDPGSDIVRLGDGGAQLEVQTNYGYIRIGPNNTGWSHFYTDRARYYFDKEIRVDQGLIGSYDENLQLRTSGNTRMTILNSNGNVGIGTGSPSDIVHLRGNGDVNLRLEADADNSGEDDHPKILFRQDGNLVNAWVGFETDGSDNNNFYISNEWANTSGDIRFRTQNINRMTIDGNGRVGIGTTTPTHSLNVLGNSRLEGTVQAIWATNNSSTSATGYFKNSATNGRGLQVVGHAVPGVTNTYDLGTTALKWRNIYAQNIVQENLTQGSVIFAGPSGALAEDNANLFWNDANNRLGIGDVAPQTRLEIGDPGGQSLMLSRQDGTINSGDQLGGIGFDGSDGNTPDDIKESSASIIAFASEPQGGGDKGGRLEFWTSPTNQNDDTDGVRRMRIDQNGEVTIYDLTGTGNRPVYADANGKLFAYADKGVAYASSGATGTYNHDNWHNVTAYTNTIEVRNGDILMIHMNSLLRLTGGSGNDDFDMRVFADGTSGCGDFYTNWLTDYRPDESGSNHDNFKSVSHLDYRVCNCNGNYRFILQVYNSGDDDFQARDRVVIVDRK